MAWKCQDNYLVWETSSADRAIVQVNRQRSHCLNSSVFFFFACFVQEVELHLLSAWERRESFSNCHDLRNCIFDYTCVRSFCQFFPIACNCICCKFFKPPLEKMPMYKIRILCSTWDAQSTLYRKMVLRLERLPRSLSGDQSLIRNWAVLFCLLGISAMNDGKQS